MQEKLNIKEGESKYTFTWGEDNQSKLYLPEDEVADFFRAMLEAEKKMKDISREIKTEQIAVSHINTQRRIWSYKNGNVQIEWNTLLKKVPTEDFFNAINTVKQSKKKYDERKKREKEEFDKKYKILYRLFIFGLISGGIAAFSFALIIGFLFFVREYIHIPIILFTIFGTSFAVIYYLQQKNMKNLVNFAQDNMGESVLPLLSNIPGNRKVVEMMVVAFIVMVIMGIYFSKTIPKILDFYKNPVQQNI